MGAWRAAALATEFGFSVVGSLVGGVAIGLFADRQLHTTPLFFLLGLLVGLIFSIYLIYVIYRIQIQPRRQAAAGAAVTTGAANVSGVTGMPGVAGNTSPTSSGSLSEEQH